MRICQQTRDSKKVDTFIKNVIININKMEHNEIKKVLKIIKANNGSTINEIVEESNVSRGQVRISLAYLLGAKKINERAVGMSKLYYEK